MMIVRILLQRRRVLLLCVATLALHYVALDWVGLHAGAPAAARPGPVVSVQLRAVPPLTSLAPVPVPAAPPAPLPVRQRSAAPPVIAAAGAGAEHGAAETAMQVQSAAAAASDTAPAATVAQAAASDTAPAATVAPAAALAPEAADDGPPPRLYRVELPPSADMDIDVKRIDADGAVWNGAGALSWQQDGSSYKTTIEAGLNLLVTRVNLLVISSEGRIDDHGIAPVMATERRKGRSLTATHFNRDELRITFSASELAYPLLPGTQDKATLPFQLAGIGRADVNQFSGDIDLFVGEDKEANVFRFNLVGEEELDTKMGPLLTWHLSRPPKPGTYSSRLDIWLAPARGWYPVQIRNTEANGAVTTQSVSRITVTAAPGT
jgi:hypothetical protein